MKKKFLIFTLCFTLIFSSFNYKKTYADAGIISGPMFATIATLGVASGVVLNNSDDIVKFCDMFYQKNKENWQEFNQVFNSCVSIGFNKVVTVGKEFLDKFNDFISKVEFANSFQSSTKIGDFVLFEDYNIKELIGDRVGSIAFDNIFIHYEGKSYPFSINASGTPYFYTSYGALVDGFHTNIMRQESGNWISFDNAYFNFGIASPDVDSIEGYTPYELTHYRGYGEYFSKRTVYLSNTSVTSVNTVPGVYVPGNINDNIKDDKLDVYVPGNVDSLVGVNPGDVIYNPSIDSPPYDLPVGGVVTVPGSDIIDGSVSFPSVDSPSVPNEGIWSTIKDFIIGLVVPSDAFWTDTWGSLYNNFTDSFPMVDMSGFNDLVTGEKKFPNIDIDVMGVTGRVVNGDVINSIVDWLRPIIAGFMMICLMLFNYRKIYKLIRNTEPFGGIAPGTSDFKTGISEYTHVGLVNDGFKRSEEEELARSRYYEEMHFRNGGKL